MIWLLAIVVGYVVGSINPASLIARARGIDLREVGSGNPGATNVGRAMGKKTAVLVGALDILKGFVPALGFVAFTGDVAVGELAGFAAVLGHVTSPFLHGHGGKGVATSVGAVLAIQPLWLIPVLLVFALVFAVSKRMGIASLTASLVLIPASIVWHSETSQIVFATALALLIVVRHQSNIRAALRRD